MNANHKVTDSVPKMTGPYCQCSSQRHTLGSQNDPFHLVGSPNFKEIFKGMWTYSMEETLKLQLVCPSVNQYNRI